MQESFIVLDMDETLLHSMDMRQGRKIADIYDALPKHLGAASYFLTSQRDANIWGLKRPHVDAFIAQCKKTFTKVILWSAGEYAYVHACVKANFPDTFDAIFTRKDCYMQIIGNHMVAYKKPLTRLAHIYDKRVTLANTIVVDDSCIASSDNYLNHIRVPRWAPDKQFAKAYKHDTALKVLSEWISMLDFRKYETVHQLNLDIHLGVRQCIS